MSCTILRHDMPQYGIRKVSNRMERPGQHGESQREWTAAFSDPSAYRLPRVSRRVSFAAQNIGVRI
jgi:hypothetical protein